MNWEVIIKWLPRLAEGAVLTLELVAIAVIAMTGMYFLEKRAARGFARAE